MNLRKKIFDLKKRFISNNNDIILNTFYNFLYTYNKTTYNGSHIRDSINIKSIIFIVILSLMPSLFFGAYNAGYQHYKQLHITNNIFNCFLFGMKKIFPIISVSYITGLIIEFFFAIKKKHEVNESFLITGLLISLILPINIPLWIVSISVIFSVIFAKEIFGGTGMNIFNPALIARAFIFFSYPKEMSGNEIWVYKEMINEISRDSIIKFFNNFKYQSEFAEQIVLNGINVSTKDIIIGLIPGSIGETSLISIFIGGLILIITDIGSWKIILSAIIGGSLIGLIFNYIGYNSLMLFPWWKHLMIGGFGFGIVFMATDPVSSSQTEIGKWIYGFCIGFFSILIRICNGSYAEGVMIVILLMNIFAPTIDYFIIRIHMNKRINRWIKHNSWIKHN